MAHSRNDGCADGTDVVWYEHDAALTTGEAMAIAGEACESHPIDDAAALLSISATDRG